VDHAGPLAAAIAVLSSSGLAAALVFRHLGTKPLWLDETVSVSVARRPLTRLLGVLSHRDANAGLYYLLLHAWLRLGHSAAWTRAPSAAAFVATAGLAAWLGSRWRGSWFGLACGLLVATNGFLLFYGQEARPYAPAVMIAVGSTAALFWRDGEPAPTAHVVLTVLLLYVDLFAILFVAAQASAVVVAHRWRRAKLPAGLARCWALIAAATAPLALLMITGERSQISWLTRPSFRYLAQTVTAMTNGWLGLIVMGALAALALGAAVVLRRRDALVVGALLASFAIPPLTLWLFAQVVPSFIDRYVICSTIGIIGLAAAGLDVLRTRTAQVVALATLALLSGLGLSRIARLEREPFKYENPPAAVAFVASQTQHDDAVGFAGGGLRTLIDAYLRPGEPFPGDIALAPGGAAAHQHDIYAREVGPAALAARLSGVQRLWLITDPSNHRYPPFGPFALLRPAVARAFQPEVAASFPGIDVTLFTRRTATPPGPER
jgi:mannosyltransferase